MRTTNSISYIESWHQAKAFIRQYNDAHVQSLSGSGLPIYDLKCKLRKEHRDLLFIMIRLYAQQLYSYELLRIQDRLPPFRTNSRALAKVMDCCPRTVRNLITRLIESGAIREKTYRGRRHNYELNFDPGILKICKRASPKHDLPQTEDQLQEIDQEDLSREFGKRLPPLDAVSKKKKNNRVGGNVESGKMKHTVQSIPQDGFAGNTGSQEPEKIAAGPKEKEDSFAKETGSQDRVAGKVPPGGMEPAPETAPGPAIQGLDWERCGEYHLRLFSLILSQLYPRLEYLADSQAFQIKRYLARQFALVPPEQYHEIYHQLRIRIMIVADYLKRDPRRFVPIPSRYFSLDNPHGFEKSLQWYEAMQHNTAKIEAYKVRYQTLMKAWGGFTSTIGEYLNNQGYDNYQQGRRNLAGKYPNLIRAYDYVILSTLQNQKGEA